MTDFGVEPMTGFISVHLTQAEKLIAENEHKQDEDRRYKEAVYGPDSPLHENLRKFRTRNGLKKLDVATLMGVTPRSYYAYEEGLRPVPSDALCKLATMTKADLNEIVMGRPAQNDAMIIRHAIDDLLLIMKFLERRYPTMDIETLFKVACHAITADTGDWPRTSPEMIESSVKVLTRYRFHPEELPSPPERGHYEGKLDQFEKAVAAWQAMVDESFGE